MNASSVRTLDIGTGRNVVLADPERVVRRFAAVYLLGVGTTVGRRCLPLQPHPGMGTAARVTPHLVWLSPGEDAMALTILAVASLNVVLFLSSAIWSIQSARKDPSPRMRVLFRALGAASAAFVLASVTRLVSLCASQGWIGGSASDVLASGWHLTQASIASVLGIGGIMMVRRVAAPIRSADRLVMVLCDRLPQVPVGELGLTARELEVIEAIADGALSDKDIADALYVSPATAGTHVKNVMRKAGCHSRRELILLAIGNRDEPTTGTR